MTKATDYIVTIEDTLIMMKTSGNTVYAARNIVNDIVLFTTRSLVYPSSEYWGVRLAFNNGHNEEFVFDTQGQRDSFVGKIFPFFFNYDEDETDAKE